MTQEELLAAWTDGMPKIALAELDQLAARNGYPFPTSYVEVVTRHGLPYFDAGKVFEVDWRKADGSSLTAEEREDIDPIQWISTLDRAEGIAQNTEIMHAAIARGRPMFAAGLVPFSTDSSGQLLLFKCDAPLVGSVWTWYWSDEPWGTGDNIWIGFVADSFDDFLFNRLRDPGPGD